MTDFGKSIARAFGRAFGQRLVNPALTGAYSAEALAYFAAMDVEPDATRKGLINDMIVGLKADGVWTLLDWLTLHAAHDEQAARINVRTPSKVMSAVNSPTFEVDRGFTGDGSTSYLDAGEHYNASGNVYVQDSAHLGIWSRTSGQTTTRVMGVLSGFVEGLLPRNTSDQFTARMNAGTEVTIGSGTTDGSGHFIGNRSSSTALQGYRNGTGSGTGTTTSTGIDASNITILRSNTMYSARQVAASHSGGSIDATQSAALYARLNTYMTAIGAA